MELKLKYFNYMVEDVIKASSQETLKMFEETCTTNVTNEFEMAVGILTMMKFINTLADTNVPEREQIAIAAIITGYCAFIKDA